MIQAAFNFSLDSSDFPVSIEEFAAYIDGNLSDDEMQRISSVIEYDDTMQGVMDSMEQSELTLAEYTPDDLQLPEEIAGDGFEVQEIKKEIVFNPPLWDCIKVAAIAPATNCLAKNPKTQTKPPQVLDGNNDDNKME